MLVCSDVLHENAPKNVANVMVNFAHAMTPAACIVANNSQASVQIMSRQVRGSEMLQSSKLPVFSTTSSIKSEDMSDMSETEFEDDISDYEYAGRRSEDSVSIASQRQDRIPLNLDF